MKNYKLLICVIVGIMSQTIFAGTSPDVVRNKENSALYDTGYGEKVWELAGPNSAVNPMKKHSMAIVEIDPLKGSKNHRHPSSTENLEETYYVISGVATVTLDSVKSTLKAGDLIAIPPDTAHQVTNISSTEKLVLLVSCAGPWVPQGTEFLD